MLNGRLPHNAELTGSCTRNFQESPVISTLGKNKKIAGQGHRGVKNKVVTMIGIAAVFGAVSIFAADFWLKSEASQQVETRTIEIRRRLQPKVAFQTIVVASAPLRFGMQLDRAQLTEIQWPQDALPAGAFPTIDALLAEGSRVVLSPMESNEPVLLAKLSGPNGRASLSNLLSPGMRAVTIKTDEIAGVGGFITPGDRVDIVLTRDAGAIDEVKTNAEGAAGSTIASEIVVENAKVLSVGQGADQRQTSADRQLRNGRGDRRRRRQDRACPQYRHAVAAASRGRRTPVADRGPDDDLGLRRLGHESARERGERCRRSRRQAAGRAKVQDRHRHARDRAAILPGGRAGELTQAVTTRKRSMPAGAAWGRQWVRENSISVGGVRPVGLVRWPPRRCWHCCHGSSTPRRRSNVIQISSNKTTSIKIAKGKPKTIKTNVPFYEIVIGDPEIANVNPLTDSSFYVLGNKLGTTGIALFDENKQLVGSVDIEVTLDADKLASTIRDWVPGTDIDVKSANGRLVLSGSAGDSVAADKATSIATEFSGDEKVINSVNISSSQQVQLNVRFVEVNRQVGAGARHPDCRGVHRAERRPDLQLDAEHDPRRPRSASCSARWCRAASSSTCSSRRSRIAASRAASPSRT